MQNKLGKKQKPVIINSPPIWGEGGQLTIDEFKRERIYQVCIAITRMMLANNIITEDFHCRIDEFLIEKHRPLLGGLGLNALELSAQLDD